jgi:hypothetical protein
MWSVVGRDVSKHPLNTLDSLRSKISGVMADMDRKVVICPCKKLKVPKREIFVTELLTLSDPIWVGDLRTEPKKPFV